MKSKSLPVAAGLMILAANAQAQLAVDGAHYPVGLEGIKGGSLPEPGIYLRDDNLFYTGTSDVRPDFKTFVYLQAPQLTWMTDWKILGASYGLDVMVPFVYREASHNQTFVTPNGHVFVASVGGSHSGLGDIKIEPLLLAWHLRQFDFMFGYAVWVPTGDYSDFSMLNLGSGCWTHMITLGGVWYPDRHKTWAFSLLNHYEFNSQIPGTITSIGPSGRPETIGESVPCSTYSLEWGVSKTIFKTTDLGVTGYYQRQFTDRSEAVTYFSDFSVAGIGPEIRSHISSLGLSCSLRYAYEFWVDKHPRGHTLDFTLTKRF